ncbi:MAG: hypothetical protein GY774_35445 [Planctomycetes bacterium]|nr:hypothetical protein [Planctomycetota bacterium]
MTPDPKIKPVKLSPAEYHELRVKIYRKQRGHCINCTHWFQFDEFSLHHKISRGAGGGDTEENCVGYCVACHPD